MKSYEIISLILQAIGLISLILVVVQISLEKKNLSLINKQQTNMHEEQRRIQTINVISTWNAALKKETRLAEKIVEKLSPEQCKELYDYTPFYVSKNIHKMLCQMCSEQSDSCHSCLKSEQCEDCVKNDKNEYLVSGVQLTELRGNVTNYLNNLEIVAISWQQAIVDTETLIIQFSYLYTPGTKSALQNYRNVAGNGNSYPALNSFYEEIKKYNTKTVTKKNKQ